MHPYSFQTPVRDGVLKLKEGQSAFFIKNLERTDMRTGPYMSRSMRGAYFYDEAHPGLYSKGGSHFLAAPLFSSSFGKQRNISIGPKTYLSGLLGHDYSLGYHRSLHVGPKNIESSPLYEKMNKLNQLTSDYALRGRRDLVGKQNEILSLYKDILGTSHGGRFAYEFAAMPKDSYFREYMIGSSVTPEHFTSNVTLSQLGKGYHQLAKLHSINEDYFLKSGFSEPAFTGSGIVNEYAHVARLNKFEGIYSGDRFLNRFGAKVGYSLSTTGGTSQLADSYALLSKGVRNLYSKSNVLGGKSSAGIGYSTKSISLGNLKHQDLKSIASLIDMHPELQDDVIKLLQDVGSGKVDPKTASPFVRSEADYFLYKDGPKRIKAHSAYGRKFWLGESVDPTLKPGSYDPGRRSVFYKSEAKSADVLGYRFKHGSEGLSMEIMVAEKLKRGGPINIPMIISNRRIVGLNTGTKRGNIGDLDILMRAEEAGLKAGIVSDDFANRYIQHLAHKSRSAGKLGTFAQALDLNFGKNVDSFVSHKNMLSAINSPLRILASLKGMDQKTLETLGLTSADISLFNLTKNNELTINLKSHLVRDITVGGVTHKTVVLDGQEASFRATQPIRAKYGSGAVKLGMSDFLGMYGQLAGSAKGGPFAQLKDLYLNEILYGGGNIAATKMGAKMGSAGRQVAMLGYALANGRPVGGLAGDYFSDFINDVQASSIDESTFARLHQNRIPGQLDTVENVENFNRRGSKSGYRNPHSKLYKGELVRLSSPVPVQVGERVVNLDYLPVLNDQVLGGRSPNTSGRVTLSGRTKGIDIVKIKNAMLQAMTNGYEYASFNGQNLSIKELQTLYMNALVRGASGKQGFLNRLLKANPRAAMYGMAVPANSLIGDRIDEVVLNPKDAKRLIHSYTKNRAQRKALNSSEFFVQGIRHPVHTAGNLPVLRVVTSKQIERGTIGLHDTLMPVMKGDFDTDRVGIFSLKNSQETLREIHKSSRGLFKSYQELIAPREARKLNLLMSNLSGSTPLSAEAIREMASKTIGHEDIVNAIASRMGGAAGGGAFVPPVHMAYARYDAIIESLRNKGAGRIISSVEPLSPKLAKELSALSRGSKVTYSALGLLREAGIYGFLKKAGQGFGDGNTDFLSAVARHVSGENVTYQEVKDVLIAGLRKSQEAELLTPSQIASFLKKSGVQSIDDTSLPEKLAGIILGEGTDHQGILTVARLRELQSRGSIADDVLNVLKGTDISLTDASKIPAVTERTVQSIIGTIPETAGGGGPAAAKAQSQITSMIINELAEVSGSTVEDIAQSVNANVPRESAMAPSTSTSPASRRLGRKAGSLVGEQMSHIQGIFKTKWGKIAGIGIGGLIGFGGVDAIFGSNDEQEFNAPIHMGQSGAPMPHSMGYGAQSYDHQMPTADYFQRRAAGPARIERPYATQQMYNIDATTDDPSNFSLFNNSLLGNIGLPPASYGVITDKSVRNEDMSYYARSRVLSSF